MLASLFLSWWLSPVKPMLFQVFFEMEMFPSGHFEVSTWPSLGSPWEESEIALCVCSSDAVLFGFNLCGKIQPRSGQYHSLGLDPELCMSRETKPSWQTDIHFSPLPWVWWDWLLQVPAALISAIIDFTSELYGKINPWFWVGGEGAWLEAGARSGYLSTAKDWNENSCFDYVSAACFVNGSCYGASHVQAKGQGGVLLEWVAVIRNDGGWGLQLACEIPMPSWTQPHALLLLHAAASLTFDVHLSTAPLLLFIWIISDTFALRFCFCPCQLLYQGLKPVSRKCSSVHVTLICFYWATSSFVKSYGRRKVQQAWRFHKREENHFIILLL